MGGLAAAHELAERGFTVDVYERLSIPGGKARSVVVTNEGQQGLPGEHGFRFFPGFYHHVIDTMQRIPLPGGGNVRDNLVAASMGYFAYEGGTPLLAPSIGPRNLKELIEHLKDMAGFRKVLTMKDIEHFAGKLWQIMTSCDERRIAEYEQQSWVEFIDAANQSTAYQTWFAGAMTRTLIAASGEKASARTVGDILVTLMVGGMRWGEQSDRLLNGPTNEVWVGPWHDLLTSMGVRFHFDTAVTELRLDNGGNRITSAAITTASGSQAVIADHYICALPIEVAAGLFSDDIASAAPSLAAARTLGQNVAWMSGIQFYLRTDAPIVSGHLAFAGSPWGLTAISQNQFWCRSVSTYGGGEVAGVLSVDISDWNTPGYNGLTARQCTPQQIRDETLDQMRRCLPNLPPEQLADENIHSYFIDPDIIFFDDGGAAGDNREPLFINVRGTHDVRPQAHTEIANLYLASDYVRTNTDLATMEGANEAARRAVNSLLDRVGSSTTRCTVWSLRMPRALAVFRWLDRRRFRRGQPWTVHVPRVVHWLARVAHRLPHRRAQQQ
jgi:15-cis-phytoene desaturase